MKRTIFAAIAMACFCLSSNAFGNDIFLATADGSTQIDLASGETSGTVNVYVADDFRIDTGAFLNVFGADGIEFTGANVLNPDIVVGDLDINDRWQRVEGGTIENGNIFNFHGFAVNEGTGILPSQATGNPAVDLGHVPGLGFLFAELSWELTGSPTLGGDNVAVVELGIGEGLVVDNDVQLNPSFGNFTFVNSASIPEPTSAAVLAIGLITIAARRRR